MATRKQFLKVVAEYGATFEEHKNYDHTAIIVDAPEGKIWNAYLSLSITEFYYPGQMKIGETYDELIEAMEMGTDIDETNNEN